MYFEMTVNLAKDADGRSNIFLLQNQPTHIAEVEEYTGIAIREKCVLPAID
jgi:hypothetical protein